MITGAGSRLTNTNMTQVGVKKVVCWKSTQVTVLQNTLVLFFIFFPKWDDASIMEQS